jgi:hypothetical protein
MSTCLSNLKEWEAEMEVLTIAAYLIFQTFFGFVSWHYSQAIKAHPEDLSVVEIKLWRENTALATTATMGLMLSRINGIAFLLFCGYKTDWVNVLVLFGSGLLCSLLLGVVMRKLAGPLLPALFGFPVMLIAGTGMWLTM